MGCPARAYPAYSSAPPPPLQIPWSLQDAKFQKLGVDAVSHQVLNAAVIKQTLLKMGVEASELWKAALTNILRDLKQNLTRKSS